MTQRALVLVHGAFHGPWCWHPTLTKIEKRGIRCVAVDLNRGGLEADRVALQGEVDRLRDEGCHVSAIGHSLGCASVAMLDPNTIDAALFLAGPLIGPGMPEIAGLVTDAFMKGLEPQPDGRMRIRPEVARDAFYHRCTETQADAAIARLRPTFVYASEATRTPIWQATDSTYIECTDDHAVGLAYQRAATNVFPFSASLDSDHSPMIGQSEALAEIVIEALERTR